MFFTQITIPSLAWKSKRKRHPIYWLHCSAKNIKENNSPSHWLVQCEWTLWELNTEETLFKREEINYVDLQRRMFSECWMLTLKILLQITRVVDLTGCEGHALTPLQGPNSLNFIQFLGKLANSYVGIPPGESAPGSTTDTVTVLGDFKFHFSSISCTFSFASFERYLLQMAI